MLRPKEPSSRKTTKSESNSVPVIIYQSPGILTDSKGAFGEVRKVVHKKSGLTRAAKILCKDAITTEEHTKLITEVQILTTLVRNSGFWDF